MCEDAQLCRRCSEGDVCMWLRQKPFSGLPRYFWSVRSVWMKASTVSNPINHRIKSSVSARKVQLSDSHFEFSMPVLGLCRNLVRVGQLISYNNQGDVHSGAIGRSAGAGMGLSVNKNTINNLRRHCSLQTIQCTRGNWDSAALIQTQSSL